MSFESRAGITTLDNQFRDILTAWFDNSSSL